MNKMELCWTYCDRCGAKIKVGDICYYVGDSDNYSIRDLLENAYIEVIESEDTE